VCASTIIASYTEHPALAYFPCSRVLHVKCMLLPKDLLTSPEIGGISSANHVL
jgi:hypothetical protein